MITPNMCRTTIAAILIGLLLAGCETAYYGAMEQVGVYKRDILVDRVEAAMEAQEDAKAEFQDALQRFSSVVTVEPSELKRTYEELNDAFQDAEDRAARVSDRIDAVEDVSSDLFDEWRDEINEISNAKLRDGSARQLQTSERKYNELIKAMRRAETRMAPVLTAFRDQVLFLKHNLNAQAIASLQSELTSIETDVAVLIREMEESIARAQDFIDNMALAGGSA